MDETTDTTESLLAQMAGDPQLMVNTMADVIEATAGITNAANDPVTMSRLIDELGDESRRLIELMCDGIRRREAAQALAPFIDWLADSEIPDDDPLADFLLTVADTSPNLGTFVEYRDYLHKVIRSGALDSSAIPRFTDMWTSYIEDIMTSVGAPGSTHTEYQYGVEIRWPDVTERHPDSRFGMSRYGAEHLAWRVQPPATAVLQRRLSVHGPWVDVP